MPEGVEVLDAVGLPVGVPAPLEEAVAEKDSEEAVAEEDRKELVLKALAPGEREGARDAEIVLLAVWGWRVAGDAWRALPPPGGVGVWLGEQSAVAIKMGAG